MTRKEFIKLAAAEIVRGEMGKVGQSLFPPDAKPGHPDYRPPGSPGSDEYAERVGLKKDELAAAAAGEAAAARDARGIAEEVRNTTARRMQGRQEEERNMLAEMSGPIGMPYPEMVARLNQPIPQVPGYAETAGIVGGQFLDNLYGSNRRDQGWAETIGETIAAPVAGLYRGLGHLGAPAYDWYRRNNWINQADGDIDRWISNAGEDIVDFGKDFWQGITGEY